MHGDLIPALATIPAGDFLMGSDEGEDDERPIHRVHVDEFQIGVHPVSNLEYAGFVRETGHRPPGVHELPLVVTVANGEREESFRQASEAYAWQSGEPPRRRLDHPVPQGPETGRVTVVRGGTWVVADADAAAQPSPEGAAGYVFVRHRFLRGLVRLTVARVQSGRSVTVSRVLNAFFFALAAVSPVAAQPTPAVPPPSSEGPTAIASGEGTVKRPPDRAWIQVSAESRARSPREAQKLNADVMSAVLQKLRGARLPEDAIQTRGYDLQPEYDYISGKQVLRGYVARNTVEVRVDELSRVGELLDIAVSSGATSVGNIRFDLKDRASAERDALRLAVEDARRRADAAASGAGMRVERVVRIEEHRIGEIPPPRPMVAMAGMRQADMAAPPPIEAGELEIRASVTLIAAIK